MSGPGARKSLDQLIRDRQILRALVMEGARSAPASPASAAETLARARENIALWRLEDEQWQQRQQEAERRLDQARRNFTLWLEKCRRETAQISRNKEKRS